MRTDVWVCVAGCSLLFVVGGPDGREIVVQWSLGRMTICVRMGKRWGDDSEQGGPKG